MISFQIMNGKNLESKTTVENSILRDSSFYSYWIFFVILSNSIRYGTFRELLINSHYICFVIQ